MSTSFGLSFLKQYVLRVNFFSSYEDHAKNKSPGIKMENSWCWICAIKDGKLSLKKKSRNYLLHFLVVYIARFILPKLNFVVSLFSGTVN